jgi:hypothetical protein
VGAIHRWKKSNEERGYDNELSILREDCGGDDAGVSVAGWLQIKRGCGD